MIALFGLGALTLAFAGFWVLLGGFAILAPEHPDDRPLGVLVILVGGLIPAAFAAGLFILGALSIRKISRYSRLAVFVRSRGETSPQAVARELSISEGDAERLLFDAYAAGLIEDPLASDGGQARDDLDEETIAMPREPVEQPRVETRALDSSPPSGPKEGAFAQTVSHADSFSEPSIRFASDISFGSDLSRSLSGMVLNDTYQIEEPVGIGGMGAVYVARHVRTGKRYAVKALLPDARFSEDAIRRFKREAAAASALGHRGIVEVHDFNVTPNGVHYLVCELLIGMTLEDRLRRDGSLEWDDASSIIIQVGEALHAAHTEGILHRDLKPGNIYLDTSRSKQERAVLLDFGLAKPLDDVGVTKITTSGIVVGTPLYMSPEQACSEKLDERADVYALGAVFYETLTGAPPFMADTIAGVYNRLLTEEARPPSELSPHRLPPDVDTLMIRALAKEPAERFQNALGLTTAIKDADACWDAPRDTAVDSFS